MLGAAVALDVVILGGGAAGLWTLDVLNARGIKALLIELYALGSGQTIASQGIIHGGLKYSLQGLLTRSAANIKEMPRAWRECLSGERIPNLKGVRMRSDFCHLWRTDDLSSRLGMLGASLGLRVTPDIISDQERPGVLAGCPGTVARLAEPVISPGSFLSVLRDKNFSLLLKADPGSIELVHQQPGRVSEVRIANGRDSLALRPKLVMLTAGSGNAELLALCGLNAPPMQRRPLHMAMVRGKLPDLNGHCVDGAKTRVTITTERLSLNSAVWQLGGQIAEDGVNLDSGSLISNARSELEAVLPGIDLARTEWSTVKVDRAEALMAGNKRPDDIQVHREGNVIVAWPTKLALVPELTRELVRHVDSSDESVAFPSDRVRNWPAPEVAAAPWETAEWQRPAMPVAA